MDRSQNRLKKVHQLVDEAGGQARFAEIVGISPSQAWQIAGSAPIRNIGSKMAARIEQAFNKPSGWLDWPADDAPLSYPLAHQLAPCRRIPVFYRASEIAQVVTGAMPLPKDPSAFLGVDIPLSEFAFGLEIHDLSMAPQFQPGDKIIVDPLITPEPGSCVAALLRGSIVLFAKYRPHDLGGTDAAAFDLVPLNDDFPSFRSDSQTMTIVGTAVEHRRYLR